MYTGISVCVRAWRIPLCWYSISISFSLSLFLFPNKCLSHALSLSLSPSLGPGVCVCVCVRTLCTVYDDSSKLYSTLNWNEVLVSLFVILYFYFLFSAHIFQKKRICILYTEHTVSWALNSIRTKQLLHRCALCNCVL